MITELLAGVGATSIVGVLAAWLGKVWAARILERDRTKYQTQMETLLQDLRTLSSKELFIHQLQFEKEFQVYLELWKEVLALGRASSAYRELFVGAYHSDDQKKETFLKAHKDLSLRVYDHRPFYSPEVYRLAREVLAKSGKAYRMLERSWGSDRAENRAEELFDELNGTIDPLCDAIRQRIWDKKLERTESDHVQGRD